jgi:hypothetical protein
VPARKLLDDHPADVVPVSRVLAPGIAETYDEQVERRGAFAPTPGKTHLLGGAGLALLRSRRFALGCALRLALGDALSSPCSPDGHIDLRRGSAS